MNRDLTYLLNGAMPRSYGDLPKTLGKFEILAPM